MFEQSRRIKPTSAVFLLLLPIVTSLLSRNSIIPPVLFTTLERLAGILFSSSIEGGKKPIMGIRSIGVKFFLWQTCKRGAEEV